MRANNECQVSKVTGQYDLFGSEQRGEWVDTPCCVITYDMATHKTSVRADTSGSRGRAEHLIGIARFLFKSNSGISRGDFVRKDGFTMRVIETHPRYDVAGKLDHIEADMEKAEDDAA